MVYSTPVSEELTGSWTTVCTWTAVGTLISSYFFPKVAPCKIRTLIIDPSPGEERLKDPGGQGGPWSPAFALTSASKRGLHHQVLLMASFLGTRQ